MVCHEMEELTVESVNEAVLGSAQPPRAFRDHVEYWLDVGQKADYAQAQQDAARCSVQQSGGANHASF